MTRDEEERIYRGVEGYGPKAGPALRLPPHNHEAEVQLLGAILANNRAFHVVSPFLKGEHFADDRHGRIFEACAKLIDRGQKASATTIRGYFEQDASLDDVGGVQYIGKMAACAVTIINSEDHGRIVLDCWQRRELIARLTEAADRLHDIDIDSTAADAASTLVSEVEAVVVDTTTVFKTARQVRERIVDDMKKPLVFHSTGIRPLDEALGGGLYPGKCVGLFGRFKSGKTLLGGEITQNVGKAARVAYVAAEMGSQQIETRALSAEVGVNSMSFLNQQARSNPAFVSRCGEAAIRGTDNIIYCDAPGLTFDRLRRIVTAAVVTHKVVGIVIDYLQLVGGVPKGSTRVDHLERACQWLADFANRRGVWVLVLGQLNSEGNARHGEAPMMAFDLCVEICRDDAGGPGAWLVTRVSRYTPSGLTIGNATNPALFLDSEVGPRFTVGMGMAA